MTGTSSTCFLSSPKQKQEIFKWAAHRAQLFKALVPVFRTPTTLQELEACPKNLAEGIKAALAAVRELEAAPTHYISAHWIDQLGIPIAYYLSSWLQLGSLIDGKGGGEMEVDCEYEDGSEIEVGRVRLSVTVTVKMRMRSR
jgi:hypothetical protein